MIRIKLNEEEKKELQKLRSTRSPLGERAYYILLSDKGLRIKKIAQKVNRHEHTIRSWIKGYVKLGIKGLKSKSPPGRVRIKGPKVEKELEDMLRQTPRDFGYQEAGWTVRLMIDYFSKKDISVKEDTVRRALKRKKWVYKRFAKSVPQSASSKEEKKEKIEKLVQEVAMEQADEVFFVDEANFTTGPYVQRGWFKQGEKKS